MYSVLEYLEDSVKRFPDKIAFADPEEEISFSELMRRAKRIGTALARALPPGSPVPVHLPKSVQAVTVFLGALYAGCFYVFLDRKQPAARLKSILETLDAAVLVTDESGAEAVKSFFDGTALDFKELLRTEADEALLGDIRRERIDTEVLYVNFTSGSTGVPKGVAVSHRSVIDFMECFVPIFGISSEDVIGNQAPLDFDVSVKDIYSTLKSGATMVIIPQHYFSVPMQLLDYLADRGVTTLIWAVSALTLLVRLHGFEYRIPEKVVRVIFSGEVMPVKYLNEWRAALPEAAFYNVYGPTEITCNCTWYQIERDFTPEESIPIGKPFPNEKVFLLDEENRLIDSPGPVGEICVGGTALSLGYYRNPEATAAAFVQNPLNDCYPETIYRTGDLGAYLPDGNLVYIGRKDFQIKHMGHRIELLEIEKALNAVPEVSAACCLYRKEKITAVYAGTLTKKELVPRLKACIPDYMVPQVFLQLEELPLSKNGKIDRQAVLTAAEAADKRRSR